MKQLDEQVADSAASANLARLMKQLGDIEEEQATIRTRLGALMEKFIEIIDEFFSTNLAQDCKRGMEMTARQGFFNGGNVPIGYKRVKVPYGTTEKTTLAPDDLYGPLVMRVFRMYLSGMGTKDIAKALNGEGIRTPRGKEWKPQTILYMLKNQVYLGESIWNRTSHDDNKQVVANDPEDVIKGELTYPALVSHEDFQRVQSRIEALNPRKEGALASAAAGSDYLLSGLLW